MERSGPWLGTVRVAAVTGFVGLAAMSVLPARADTGGPFTFGPSEKGLFHDWIATFRYDEGGAPLKDDPSGRLGHGTNNQATLGLGSGIAGYGFARVHVGRGWRDGKRAFAFEDMRSDADSDILGATTGAFVMPFLAVGVSLQMRREEGIDIFFNKAGAPPLSIERKTRSNRVAPFVLLMAPVGPVEVALLAAYLRQNSKTRFHSRLLPVADRSDSGRLIMRLAELSAGLWVLPDLRLGASVGRSEVVSERTQGADLRLDDNWYSFGLGATYRVIDGLEINLDGGHDAGNERGNGYRWGVGFAYRF